MKLTVKDKYFLKNNKLFLFSLILFIISSLLAVISMFLMRTINIESLIYMLSSALFYRLIVLAVENTNEYCERDAFQKISYYIVCLYMLIFSLFIMASIEF